MGKTVKSPRSRGMMYTQQIRHSPYKDVDSLKKVIETKLDPKRYAIINHNKDTDDKNKPEEEHWQAMMEFHNARYLKSVAKLLGDKEQTIEIWDGKIMNGFAYLVHRTENARSKYQYSPDEVIANFDYPKLLEKITRQVKKSKSNKKIDELLDDLYDGVIQKEDVENYISGSQYGKSCRQIKDVDSKRLQREAEEFKREMQEQGKPVKVIWIFGNAGTGKSTLARKIAEKENRPYFFSGSERDIFQSYNGEHTVILDELRPKAISYSDLLKITDPYSPGAMAPSRYHDKYLACDLIIITSPFSPIAFYDETFDITPKNRREKLRASVDSFEQLKRRIALTIYADDVEFSMAEYDEQYRKYFPDVTTAKKNPYSSVARPTVRVNATKLYNDLFD